MTAEPEAGPSRRGEAIETHVPGEPEAFHTLAAYVREEMGRGVDDLGNEVAGRRTALVGTWEGEAGETFVDRAGTLASACDNVYLHVLVGAAEIDALGDTLRVVQERLADVWTSAAAAGCPTEGSLILKPVHPLKPGEIITNIFDRTPEEQATDAAFAQAAEAADGLWREWYDRINEAGGVIAERAGDIVGVLSDLITAATTQSLKTITSKVMQGQTEWLRGEIEKNKAHQTHYQAWLEKTGDQSIRYVHDELSRETISLRYAAEDAAKAVQNPELPHGLVRGLDTLGVTATGVGIYADVHDGESTGQAVTSQAAGLGAGIVGAGIAGGIAGSTIAPGPGTIGGALVVGGAELVGGTLAAIGGDKLVDALWPGYDDGENRPSVSQQRGEDLVAYAQQVIRPSTGEGAGQ